MKLETRNTQLAKQRGDLEEERATITADLAKLTAKQAPSSTGAFLSLSQRQTLSTQAEELETRLRANGKLLATIDQEQQEVHRQIEQDRRDTFLQDEMPRREKEIVDAWTEILGRLWEANADLRREIEARIQTPMRELQEASYSATRSRDLSRRLLRIEERATKTSGHVIATIEQTMKEPT